MSLVDVPPFLFPALPMPFLTGTLTPASTTMDAVGEGYAAVLFPTKAGSIRTITYYVNGSSTLNGTVRAGIYAVDAATGLPVIATPFGGMVAGTLAGGSLPGGASAVSITLGTDCTIGSGDLNTPIAVVIDLSVRTSGATTVRGVSFPFQPQGASFPYSCLNTGSWAKQANVGVSVLLTYSDGSVAYIPTTLFQPTTFSVASNTNPDEFGTKYIFPFKCRVIGVQMAYQSAVQDHSIILYDGSSNVLKSITIDKDNAISATGVGRIEALFSSPQTINAGDTVRLTVLPTSTTAMTINAILYPSAAWTKQAIGNAAYGVFQSTKRVDAGAWTDVPYTLHPYSLIIDQIDVGGAGAIPGIGGLIR